MTYTFEIEQRFLANPPQRESLDEFLDRVIEHIDQHRLAEADYLVDLSTNTATWTMTVEAEDKYTALTQALGVLRNALRSTEGGWLLDDELRSVSA